MENNNFPRSTSTLIGIIQWALTVRQAQKEGDLRDTSLLTDPHSTYALAVKYGFTFSVIERELIRIGYELEGERAV